MRQANRISIDLQLADYVAAAQFRHLLQARQHRRANWMFVTLIGCVGLVIVASDLSHGRIPTQALIMWGMMASVYGFFFLNYRILLPRQIKRAYLKQKYPIQTVTLEWDDARAVLEDPVTKTTASWAEMTRWLEDPKLFVLEFRGTTLMYVPKRVLHGAISEDAFRQLLQAKIGPQGIVRA